MPERIPTPCLSLWERWLSVHHPLPLPPGEVAERTPPLASPFGRGGRAHTTPCLSLRERWPSAARSERVLPFSSPLSQASPDSSPKGRAKRGVATQAEKLNTQQPYFALLKTRPSAHPILASPSGRGGRAQRGRRGQTENANNENTKRSKKPERVLPFSSPLSQASPDSSPRGRAKRGVATQTVRPNTQ